MHRVFGPPPERIGTDGLSECLRRCALDLMNEIADFVRMHVPLL